MTFKCKNGHFNRNRLMGFNRLSMQRKYYRFVNTDTFKPVIRVFDTLDEVGNISIKCFLKIITKCSSNNVPAIKRLSRMGFDPKISGLSIY